MNVYPIDDTRRGWPHPPGGDNCSFAELLDLELLRQQSGESCACSQRYPIRLIRLHRLRAAALLRRASRRPAASPSTSGRRRPRRGHRGLRGEAADHGRRGRRDRERHRLRPADQHRRAGRTANRTVRSSRKFTRTRRASASCQAAAAAPRCTGVRVVVLAFDNSDRSRTAPSSTPVTSTVQARCRGR